MWEAIIACSLVFGVALISFVLGVALGSMKSKKRFDDWVEDNACYTCHERYSNGGDTSNSIG